MTKTKTIFSCQHCGSQYAQWQGQCRDCGEWNSIVEEVTVKKSTHRASGFAGAQSVPILLSNVSMQSQPRLATGLAEFDHVLGGGLVSDSVVLIGGDPGVGKSTLLLQILCQISRNYSTLYISGEESLQQIALRAQRLQLPQDKLTLLAETHIEQILVLAEQSHPQVMVIDSIQTVYTDTVPSAPGGVGQVRESAAQLVRFAKQKGIALFIVGHMTKEGAIAGPRVLEHMVDAVLYFEGKNDSRFRVIRAVKNRFGAVNEIGVFAMTNAGLKQVNNPSAIFLSRYETPVSGSVVTVTWEGSRPLLVEVQALVDESHLANPRRVTVGLEQNRLSMLLATLHRHGGVPTYDQDVFVNAVGGLRIVETGADLPVLLAVLSSLRNKPLPSDLIVFGEVGLAGEIRPVPSGQERIKEAVKHGFKRAIVPKANAPKDAPEGMEIVAADKLQSVLNYNY
ncbi:DNA repair protein RadA [Coxiella burnetii]|uniref:DNA repair protein RadA n=1 Tax=Coxiella burnetii TaxID=777 RepID=UPI000593A0C9|nr:DNA repair protein RadA [Coxiella burnetii]AML49665.1 DNA repair protein RadA [Coxiella burnetii]AML55568.1 DNA repair protein RadA [Coxiella burnetii]ATN69548.1 DNA repair protein RadA [Coxiella burnetii]ATN71469.1 DNA repair protein RadA [Coxiella burnetii]ATN73362.1 DNA repair protein RadA [Coxiella burnetii]